MPTHTMMMNRRATPITILTGLAAALALTAGCGVAPAPDVAPSFQGTVTLLNHTNEMHALEIYELDANISIDCDVIGQAPDKYLTDALFESGRAPYTIPLFSGEEIAVDPSEWTDNWSATWTEGIGGCRAFLVRSTTLPNILVYYNPTGMVSKAYYHNADAPQGLTPSAQTIVIEADYDQVEASTERLGWREITCEEPVNDDQDDWWGAPRDVEWGPCNDISDEDLTAAQQIPAGVRYSWRSEFDDVPLHFERPLHDIGAPISVPARCRVPGPGEGILWTTPPFGTPVIAGVERGLDGCHTVYIESGEEWLVCAPWEPLQAFNEVGPTLVRFQQQRRSAISEELTITVLDAGAELGFRELVFLRDTSARSLFGIEWEQEIRRGCEPLQEECGEVSVPVDLKITSEPGDPLVEPGGVAELSIGQFWLARAAYLPVINNFCSERGDTVIRPDTQSVFVEAVLTLD